MSVRIQLRRDTATNWTATNPTLTQGEPGYETDTGKVKYGDGSTAWNSLAYAPAAAIVDGTIVNADVNASADIAGTKIAPNFGSQAVTTTGTSTAASFIPTSSTAPSLGLYTPSAGSVAISTNGTGRLFVDASGRVGINKAIPSQTLQVVSATGGTTARFENTSSGNFVDFYETTGGTRMGYIGHTSATDMYIHNDKAGPLVFDTNNTERLRITSAGLVGVGTSSASSKIHIKDAHTLSADSQIALIENTTAGQPASLGFKAVTGAGAAGNAGAIYFDAGAAGFIDDNKLQFTANHQTSIVPAMTLDGQGRLAIGTTSASALLHVEGGGENAIIGSSSRKLYFRADGSGISLGTGAAQAGTGFYFNEASNFIYAQTNTSERFRCDSSGRLLVGTSTSSASYGGGVNTLFQVAGGTGNANAYPGISCSAYSTADSWATVSITKSNSNTVGTQTAVAANHRLGELTFEGSNGTSHKVGASIYAENDQASAWGATDCPSRLVFSTCGDGASTPTERLRITQAGFTKLSNAGTYYDSTGAYHEARTTANDASIIVTATNATYIKEALRIFVTKAANSDWWFADYWSGVTTDKEFGFRGDGQAYADGSWNGGGADYAEYFEWSDSNPDVEDRRGISVVLDGEKIREAQAGEDPIGVISGNPSVVGDAAWNKWSGKYLRDEFGTYIQEDYEMTDDDGNTVIQQRRKLNPAYDPDVEYVSREQRPEWDCVGLMGKLRIRKGQVTGSRWIKMRDISDSVEEWLVR